MKLITKLLPLTCVAAAASVVVPLATSCTTGNVQTDGASYSFDYEYNIKKDKVVKPLYPYVSKVTPAEMVDTEGIDTETATQIYFDKLTEDKSVFADDLAWGFYWNVLIYVIYYNSNIGKYKGSADCHVSSFDSETGKISFSLSTRCEFEKEKMMNAEKADSYYINRTIEINNMPIAIIATPSGYWAIDRNKEVSEDELDDFSVKFVDEYAINDIYNNNNIVWNIDNYDAKIVTLAYTGQTDEYDGLDIIDEAMYCLDPCHYLINNYPED